MREKKKNWESASRKNSKDRSCMWHPQSAVCLKWVWLLWEFLPWGDINTHPLLIRLQCETLNPKVLPRESVGPQGFLTEHGWEAARGRVQVTPRQPHWAIFTQREWQLPCSHIDEPFLLTFPSLDPLAPSELWAIGEKLHTNNLGGQLESWVTLSPLSFCEGRWQSTG